MAQSDPWKAETLGEGRYKFTNVSGRKLGAISVMPFPGGEAEVEGASHPYSLPTPVEPGKSFVAKVRGSVRITGTVPVTMENVFWKFDTP